MFAASAEVTPSEVIAVVKFLLMSSVGVVCILLLRTGCQGAACSAIWKNYAGKLNCFFTDCVCLCTNIIIVNQLLFLLIGKYQIMIGLRKVVVSGLFLENCWLQNWCSLCSVLYLKLPMPWTFCLPSTCFRPKQSSLEYELFCNTIVPLLFGFT